MKNQKSTIENRKSKIGAKRRAFTLVETVLALGLTAIGLIALLGLIPHGLDVMKTATNKSVEARIAQELVGEVMLADWDDVDDFDDTLRYFDNEGVEIEVTDSDFDTRITYVSRIEIPELTATASDNSGFRLPGHDRADPDMKRVVVHVLNSPFEVDLLDDTVREEYKDKIHIYASTVMNLLK